MVLIYINRLCILSVEYMILNMVNNIIPMMVRIITWTMDSTIQSTGMYALRVIYPLLCNVVVFTLKLRANISIEKMIG